MRFTIVDPRLADTAWTKDFSDCLTQVSNEVLRPIRDALAESGAMVSEIDKSGRQVCGFTVGKGSWRVGLYLYLRDDRTRKHWNASIYLAAIPPGWARLTGLRKKATRFQIEMVGRVTGILSDGLEGNPAYSEIRWRKGPFRNGSSYPECRLSFLTKPLPMLAMLPLAIVKECVKQFLPQRVRWNPCDLNFWDAELTHFATGKLESVSVAARERFSKPALIGLLKAGWREGRRANPELLARLLSEQPASPSSAALKILEEFADLGMECLGSIVCFGEVHSDDTARIPILQKIIGSKLSPIGLTYNFCGDFLVVYSDDKGRIFLDGATDRNRPENYMIEYAASSIEVTLDIMLSKSGKGFERWKDGSKGQWYYDMPE